MELRFALLYAIRDCYPHIAYDTNGVAFLSRGITLIQNYKRLNSYTKYQTQRNYEKRYVAIHPSWQAIAARDARTTFETPKSESASPRR